MSNRVALISGACGDIGRATIRVFSDKGWTTAGCDLSPHCTDEGSGFYRQVDVTDALAVHDYVAEVVAHFGRIDACVANAGIVERGALTGLSPQAWERQIAVNLTGAFYVAQAAAKAMRDHGTRGHLVLMSSWTQDAPRENIGAYCVSKSGLKMLAECLALELAPDGIRVNGIAPGYVDAGLTGRNLAANPERRAIVEAQVPAGRLMSAREVADAVVLLCSDALPYMTGSTLLLDGGASLR